MMKRLFSLLLTAALLAALASGCAPGQSSSPGQTSGPDASIQSQGSVSSSPAGSAAHGDASPALPEDNTSEPAGDISQPAEEALPSFTGGELLTGDLASMAAPIQALTRAMAGDGYTYDPYLPVFFWTSLQHALSLSGGDHTLVQPAGDELQVPRQVAQEFATALFLNYNDLPPLPDTLPGIRYDEGWDAYFLGQEAAPSAIPIAVTSVTPGGSGSYLVDGACLPPKAGYIALGHVHKFQLVPHTQGRAYYSGSPIAYHRREAGSEKMCILAEGKAGQSFRVKEIPLPVYKPIQVWRAKSPEEAIELCRLHSEEDSWVYLEVETERGYILEDEIRRMKELKKDILEIHPIVPGEDDPEGTDFSASGYEKTCSGGIGEKTLPEVFADYYRQEMKGAVPEQELIELLLELSREDGKEEAYEASEAKDQGPEQFYKRTDD